MQKVDWENSTLKFPIHVIHNKINIENCRRVSQFMLFFAQGLHLSFFPFIENSLFSVHYVNLSLHLFGQ